jgi:hypothetical protein
MHYVETVLELFWIYTPTKNEKNFEDFTLIIKNEFEAKQNKIYGNIQPIKEDNGK